jgi:hypothetical protein
VSVAVAWLAAPAACVIAGAAGAQEAVGTHLGHAPAPARPSAAQRDAELDKLVGAYPDLLAGHQGDVLIWRDGTRMPTSDGEGSKTPLQVVESPDLQDIFAWPYPLASQPVTAPLADPGRERPAAFFRKMYGDCHAGQVASNLVPVRWVDGTSVRITRVNGVATALAAVVADLKALGPAYTRYLSPMGGTYNCRAIAGTSLASMHSYGAAIDINVASSDYWQWADAAAHGLGRYRNRIPIQIVQAFERHGFIWGGRWADFDTMHFEYRPELIAVAKAAGQR